MKKLLFFKIIILLKVYMCSLSLKIFFISFFIIIIFFYFSSYFSGQSISFHFFLFEWCIWQFLQQVLFLLINTRIEHPINLQQLRERFYSFFAQVKEKCHGLIGNCTWNRKPFPCCDNFLPLHTESGLCYTINSIQTKR